MGDDLARRAHTVFVRVLELDAAERDGFLQEACAGDAALLARVRRLIAAVDQSSAFLETPALGPRPASGPPPVAVPGYRVLRLIGAGGMAAVYEAVQEQPERRVALKVMNRALTHTSAARRFRFETEVLARLQHPGIAQIYEAGTSSDGHGHSVPYFAMEFVEGARTITEFAEHSRLPLRDRMAMFAGVCDAVEHGHQRGVIHRDLKPGNILVDTGGRTKVIDFGVARSIDPDHASVTGRTDAGQIIGTLNFMSPEQCAAGGAIDTRSDVYSLGVVLYQLVTGRSPYDLSRVSLPEAARVIAESQPRRPSSFAPEARGDLDAIIGKAMDKEADRRYGSAGALAADLRRHLDDQLIEARPPTLVHQARLFARRHRALVGAVAIVLVVFVAAFILVAGFAYRTALESRQRLAAEQQATRDRDLARRASYIASVGGAMASSRVYDYAQATAQLAAAPREHRGWEWSFVSAMVEQSERTIDAHSDMIYCLTASRDGSRLATGAADGIAAVWDAENGSCVARLPITPGFALNSVALSPDGRQLFTASSDRTVRVWNIDTETEALAVRGHPSAVQSVALGPSGIAASGSSDGTALLWDPPTGRTIRRLDDQPGGISGVVYSDSGDTLITWSRTGAIWLRSADGLEVRQRLDFKRAPAHVVLSRDGAKVAAGGADGHITVWDARTAEVLHRFEIELNTTTVRSLGFSRDGNLLVSGQIDRTILLWDLVKNEKIGTLLGHGEAVSGVELSPDGSRLYSTAWDRTIRIWNVDAADRAPRVPNLTGHEGRVLAAAFSPDGLLLASGGRDRTVRLWDPELSSQLAILGPHGEAAFSVAFSPDSRTLAVGVSDGRLALWDTRTGEHREGWDAQAGPLWSVAFSPDGARLAAAGDGKVIQIWGLAERRLLATLRGHAERVIQAAFSPDGALVASASRDRTVRLWDAQTGREVRSFTGHELDVFAVAFSPDGRTLYSGSRDQSVRIWDVRTGSCDVVRTPGHFITSLALSSDASRLAAGSWFGEVFLLDPAARDVVLSFRGHNAAVRALGFSPAGSTLLCAGHDGVIRLYDTRPQDERTGRFREARSAMARAEAALNAGTPAAEVGLQPWLWKARLRRQAPPDPATH